MMEETTGFPNCHRVWSVYDLFIKSGLQILGTFHAVLWPSQNLVAQLKFKLFKTRPITVSTQDSFMEINFVYMNKCFSTEG